MSFSAAVLWWEEWQLRILWILFLSAIKRRRAIPGWFSDALAIYSLATLFNRRRKHEDLPNAGYRALEVMWVPILLMHLGGQDSITAYNIEDNELWRRHALTAVSQITDSPMDPSVPPPFQSRAPELAQPVRGHKDEPHERIVTDVSKCTACYFDALSYTETVPLHPRNKPNFKKKGKSWKKSKAKDVISKPKPPAPKANPAHALPELARALSQARAVPPQRSDVSRIMAHAFDPTRASAAPAARCSLASRSRSTTFELGPPVRRRLSLRQILPKAAPPLLHFALLRSQARGGHSPSSGVSVTLEAPQPSSRGAFTLEWRFRHPRGSASKLEGGIHPRARKARACDLSSKRRVEAPSPSSRVVAAPARAALAAGKRLPPDMAGCPRSRCTPLASADSALAVASPPRTAGFCPRLLRPRVLLFPRPVSSRLAHARLPPAARLRARVDAAHGANTAAASRCRRETSPCCPGPQTAPPSLSRRNRSPEFAEPPPSSLTRPAFSLPHHPLPLSDHTPTRFRHHSRRRSSPEKLELSLAPLLLRLNRGHQQLRRAALVLIDPFPDLLRPRRRRSPLAGVAEPPPSLPSTFPAIPVDRGEPLYAPRLAAGVRTPTSSGTSLCLLPFSSKGPSQQLLLGTHPAREVYDHSRAGMPVAIEAQRARGKPSSRGTSTLERVISVTFEPSQARGGRSPGVFRLAEGADYSGLADGVYELVPAAEEIAQESEVNVVHVDPSPEQEYRFEPEGKPRSIT
ncbi:hypothetical protein HU200_034060 [Digitaria exilis]|uniref:DUF4220 domain-containing protein n=1 Tax=Digitaria exilis TaxID=1010633 RepID=A0A835BQJ0_9POAL|nr:hypothetical protein HU200_034060 [Digitaria exilis]